MPVLVLPKTHHFCMSADTDVEVSSHVELLEPFLLFESLETFDLNCLNRVTLAGCRTAKTRTTTFENKVYCRTQVAELQPSTDYDLTPEFQARIYYMYHKEERGIEVVDTWIKNDKRVREIGVREEGGERGMRDTEFHARASTMMETHMYVQDPCVLCVCALYVRLMCVLYARLMCM